MKVNDVYRDFVYCRYHIFTILLFFCLFGPFLYLLKSNNKLSDAIQLLISIILVFTIITTIVNHLQDIKYTKSKEYLEKAIKYFGNALDILTNDKGNITDDRVSWVSAARILKNSEYLSSLITIDSHKKILEVELDILRHSLSELLNLNNGGNIYTFYTGSIIHNYVNGHYNNLDDDASSLMIPVPVLNTVLKFTLFPMCYYDRIDKKEELNRNQLLSLHDSGKNLFKYLIFRKYFIVVGRDIKVKVDGEYRHIEKEDIESKLNDMVDYETCALMELET